MKISLPNINKIPVYILLCSFICNAQLQQKIKFKRINENYGLSNSWVKNIYQDREGFIWFATGDGLNRFDGYECKVYIPENKKNTPRWGITLKDIESKGANELWVASNSGMYIFKENKLRYCDYLPRCKYPAIINQNDSISWAATSIGLLRINSVKKTFKNISKSNPDIFTNPKILSAFKDSKGHFWFGSTGYLLKYNPLKNEFKKFDQFKNLDPSTLNDILAITEDKKGNIWVGFGQNGLYYFNPKNEATFTKHSDGVILDLIVDKKEVLWIAKGSNQGLVSIDLNTGEKTTSLYDITNPMSISDSSVFSLLEDNEGDLWIGTYSGGANYYSRRNKKIHTIEGGNGKRKLKSNIVNSILEDDDYLWIGTENGLGRIHKKTVEFKHFKYEANNPKSLRRDPVFALQTDTYNNLWIGIWDGGLHKYNYNTENFTRYTFKNKKLNCNHVIALHQDSKNRLWIGTADFGLFRFDYQTNEIISYYQTATNPKGIPTKHINQIQSYGNHEILLNSGSTLKFYNPDTNISETYNLSSYLKTNPVSIICSYVDRHNNVWVGSNIGLFKFDRTQKKFTSLEAPNTINNLPIQAIAEDNCNNLWVSTNKGIFNIDTTLNRITRLSKLDGLSSNDFRKRAVYKNKKGFIYFGSSKGVNYFNPNSLSLNEKVPNLTITSLAVLKSQPNKKSKYEYVLENLNSKQEIVLDEGLSSFEISFTGLNYLNPEKNNYKYKLEGYDKVWVNSGNKRTATYTNLKAGSYIFKVTGTNNDGIESTTIKEITITKQGPWYFSDWFKALLAIIILSLPFIFYFVRLSIFKKQRKILRKKVIERTEKLTEANELLQKQTFRIQNQNKELSEHRNNLEILVANRTKELEAAIIKTKESDRLKSAFIANMSHEIRTPMNAIYGFSGLLGEEDTTIEEQSEYITIIKDSCESLLVLIDDILDISIMDAQGIQLNLQDNLNIDDFLHQIEVVFKQQENTKAPIRFVNSNNVNPTFIKTDPIRLRQILNNLLNNAIKFTEKGSIEFGYTKAENSITFFVKDTGIGISQKDLTTIFKPFIKAGNNASKIYRGTGIGLSISERITKTFKGEIWVDSTLGEGATFYVKLPI